MIFSPNSLFPSTLTGCARHFGMEILKLNALSQNGFPNYKNINDAEKFGIYLINQLLHKLLPFGPTALHKRSPNCRKLLSQPCYQCTETKLKCQYIIYYFRLN